MYTLRLDEALLAAGAQERLARDHPWEARQQAAFAAGTNYHRHQVGPAHGGGLVGWRVDASVDVSCAVGLQGPASGAHARCGVADPAAVQVVPSTLKQWDGKNRGKTVRCPLGVWDCQRCM